MNVTIDNTTLQPVAIVRDTMVASEQDALDLLGTINYMHQADRIALYKECLPETFFDLSTKLAGNILQKFSNYGVKFAVIGDFGMYTSKALRDFIRESNRGSQVFFCQDEGEAVRMLGGAK